MNEELVMTHQMNLIKKDLNFQNTCYFQLEVAQLTLIQSMDCHHER